MSPEESTAIATWVTAAVAVAFGLTGFIVGLVGLHHARQAKEAAAGANLIAKDANSLSTKANNLSEESNDIAREANEISRKTRDREDEQHDVTWDWRYSEAPREGHVTVQNLGKNLAREVTVQFMFDQVTETNDGPQDVEGRDVIHLEVTGLRGLVEAERRELARLEYERKRNSMAAFGQMHFSQKYRTRLRVKWRSDSGAPHQYDSDWIDEYLPD
jgi:hypothetical protein